MWFCIIKQNSMGTTQKSHKQDTWNYGR